MHPKNGYMHWVFFNALCTLSGFGASAISFTSWPLLVPYLLNIEGCPLFYTLFLTVLSDVVSCLLMSIIFAFKKKVIMKLWIIGIIQIPIVVFISLWFGNYLRFFEYYLKHGVNLLLFVLSVIYFVRFLVSVVNNFCKSRKKKNIEKKMNDTEINDVQTQIQKSNFNGNYSIFESVVRKKKISVKKVFARFATESSPKLFDSKNGPYSFLVDLPRHILFALCLIFTPILAGFLKISGGMVYNILLQVMYKIKPIKASATGCFISLFIMIPLVITFPFVHEEIFDIYIVYYSILNILCSSAGVFFGVWFVSIVTSEHYIYLFISVVLFSLGVASVAERYIPD